MKNFKQYLNEEASPTMTLWHGGNLNDVYNDSLQHKKGKWEYGPGLYLTTHYDTARQYSKGNRKLYRVIIEKGVNINDVLLDKQIVDDFINNYLIGNKKQLVRDALAKYVEQGKIPAFVLLNLIVNYEAIKISQTNNLRKFLVANGIDYSLVPNAFGWHEMMVVLFNMRKIVNITQIKSNDKISEFDLGTDFK